MQVALITGGDSGIGRAVAVAFAREGADVAICFKSHDEDARETVEMILKEGRKGIAIKGDAGLEEFAAQAVDRTLRELGKLDILVRVPRVPCIRRHPYASSVQSDKALFVHARAARR